MYASYPDWVLYTELTGSDRSNKGTMRLATEIKVKWIEKKIPLLEKVDMERLEYAGDTPKLSGEKRTKITMDQLESIIEQKKMEKKVKEEEDGRNKEDKLSAAKERYLNRKRQKLS
jgi:hypothetical protein